MSNINQKSIVFAFAILAVLALGTFVPKEVNAQFDGMVNPYNKPKKVIVEKPEVTSTSASSGTTNTTVAKSTTTTKKTVTTNSTGSVKGASDSNKDLSDLAANSLWGSDSFLPSGLTQWILFAILVLLLILLVRRIFGAREEYLHSPLKHS